ncbi:glycosyltransferase [Methanobacterium oryzae]|uniref:glycosyltransferase n=1 Tax=Methanobacterium oryzae TaxID=69540 RepID=UPI003D2502A0
MKVLHIGWGFRPWRGGGLIEYAEDLMDIQAENGWDIFYFFSGRHYPFTKTKIKKWKNGKINMFELINSPIVHAGDRGTLFPLLDTEENKTEIIFREILDQIKPNIIHIHELAGMPSSLIDIIKDEYNIPLVMTLHDYFLFCPTLKLFKYNNEICFEDEIGKECSFCCENAPIDRKFLIFLTFMHILEKYRLLKPINKINYILNKFSLKKLSNKSNIKLDYDKNNEKINLYQKRREINIKKLEKIDLLIAQSYRVEEIYRNFLKSNNIITLHSTVKHLDLIEKMEINVKKIIKFATLNGCSSNQKGSRIILEAVEILNKRGLKTNFELHIWGGLDQNVKEILYFENVYYHGLYKVEKLNQILNKVDVGIMPSVWEEVYGYTGIEFLAKGIPIIGNKKGGIVDYTIDNTTGWINNSASGKELANIMNNIIRNPEKIVELNRKIINNKKLIKSMEIHFNEIKSIYLLLLN